LGLVETQKTYYNEEMPFPYHFRENKNAFGDVREIKNNNNNGFHFG
jgi:hypothetical protein